MTETFPDPSGTPDLHDLLTRVAAGTLDPAEAARLLDDDPSAPTLDRTTASPLLAGVTVRGTGIRLTVLADPSVTTAIADGPHVVRQEDDRLVFDLPGPERPETGYVARPRLQLGNLRVDWPSGDERVVLRVNPALALRLELTACDAKVRGTRAELAFGCFSGSVAVLDHDGPLHGTVTAGSARIDAVLRGDRDELTCDMGSLRLTLLPGSDTTLTTRADRGQVKVVGGDVREIMDSGLHTTTVGAGTGSCTVAVRMGSAKVMLA